ncbi:hypothetical protein [Dyadobacter sp. CY326]|uniref:hypothetical protein n=1 Tax=Dyadobacter sp. CY326 TaxID=2907300 RepID=UPI001F34C072|nr:hypothetical protein [Dyadobacter sp. CY326]MCE7064982.1 hypothetical protein [Dyadobacter sp. CY326]
MFKKLVKYFSFLLAFQLSAYSFVSVYASGTHDSASSITIASFTKHFNLFCTTGNTGSSIQNSQLDVQEHIKFIFEEKNEETLRPILKKTYSLGSHFFARFYTLKSNFFFGFVKKQFSVPNHWFYCSSYRYISLQVLRI